MSDRATVFVPNRRDVAHESFDDEVILIHFPSGKYFRLDAPGRLAWATIRDGATSADVAAALHGAFEVDASESETSADALLAELRGHGLVVEAPVSVRPAGLPLPPPPPPPSDPRPPPSIRASFQPPRLEVFTDLEALFLVDPIHDVDDAGWPHAKP